MQQVSREAVGTSLEEAKRRFRRWRNGRRFCGRIPHELWRAAAEAAAVHGAEQTAAHLRLDVTRLKEWMRSSREEGEVYRPEFVELTASRGERTPECSFELEEPSGRTLRISLRGLTTADAAAFGRMLWRSSP